MSDASQLISPSTSTTSFSTACTSLASSEIIQPQYQEVEHKSHHHHQKLVRHHSRPQQRREITNQTLLLSSPLATLIYTASSTAAAVPLTSSTLEQIPLRHVPFINEKGNVLRKKRASGGRPIMLVRMGGPEVKVVLRDSRVAAYEWLQLRARID